MLTLCAKERFLCVDEIRVEDRDGLLVGGNDLQRRGAIRKDDRRHHRSENVLVQTVFDDYGRARWNRSERGWTVRTADVDNWSQERRRISGLEDQIGNEPLVQTHGSKLPAMPSNIQRSGSIAFAIAPCG